MPKSNQTPHSSIVTSMETQLGTKFTLNTYLMHMYGGHLELMQNEGSNCIFTYLNRFLGLKNLRLDTDTKWLGGIEVEIWSKMIIDKE